MEKSNLKLSLKKLKFDGIIRKGKRIEKRNSKLNNKR